MARSNAVRRGRQGELEAAADPVGVVGDLDVPAVALDDPPADRQAQAGAAVVLAGGPLEALEDAFPLCAAGPRSRCPGPSRTPIRRRGASASTTMRGTVPGASTMRWQMARPEPVPVVAVGDLARWKFSKMRWRWSSGMPMPLSRTLHREPSPSSRALGLDQDAGDGVGLDVLQGVADQVVEHLAHQDPVGPDVEQVAGDDLAAVTCGPRVGRDVLDQVAQRDRLALQCLVARHRVGEQVGDEATHLARRSPGCAAPSGRRLAGSTARCCGAASSSASAQPSITLSGLFRSWATVPAKAARDSRWLWPR